MPEAMKSSVMFAKKGQSPLHNFLFTNILDSKACIISLNGTTYLLTTKRKFLGNLCDTKHTTIDREMSSNICSMWLVFIITMNICRDTQPSLGMMHSNCSNIKSLNSNLNKFLSHFQKMENGEIENAFHLNLNSFISTITTVALSR